MYDNYLAHYGVIGMKWGKRRAQKRTARMVRKDAKRYADAKMFYGNTAGTKRKLLKAELDKKKKTIDGYEDAFNRELETVDYAKSAKKAVRVRKTTDAAYRTRVTTKQILGVTGPLTVAAATVYYSANKPKVDAFISKQARRAASSFKKTPEFDLDAFIRSQTSRR